MRYHYELPRYSHCDDSQNHVGSAHETSRKGYLGNSLRSSFRVNYKVFNGEVIIHMTYERIDTNGISWDDRNGSTWTGSMRKGVRISVQTDGTWL